MKHYTDCVSFSIRFWPKLSIFSSDLSQYTPKENNLGLELAVLGGVYMIPARLSPRSEFTPAWVQPGCCTEARISLQNEISQRYHVNTKRPPVSVWTRSAGRLDRTGSECLRFWITRVFYQHEVYLQITRYEVTQSSCKHDTKSKSHPGMKLAPVRVFSCKHPLSLWMISAR